MSYLRGKNEPNFTETLNKTKTKWSFLEDKVKLLDQFLASVQKVYESRRNIYGKYKGGALKGKDREEYHAWSDFLR